MEKQHSEPSKAVLGGHLESKDQGANQHGQKAQAEMLLLQMGGCSCSWNTNELIVTMHHGCTMSILHCGFATHPGATTQRMGIILTSVFLHLCPWKRAPMCVFYRTCCKMCDNALLPSLPRSLYEWYKPDTDLSSPSFLSYLQDAQLHEHWESITSQHCLPCPCDSQHVRLGMMMPRAQPV